MIHLTSGRKISPALVDFFDKGLKDNPLAQVATTSKTALGARNLARLAAGYSIGVRESGSSNAGPIVSLFQAVVGNPDPTPWCMSFVQACLAYAELKTGRVSPIFAHEHVLTVWRSAFSRNVALTLPCIEYPPEPGALVMWRHGESEAGHCGIVWTVDLPNFRAIEGNTSYNAPGGAVDRDGGGVALTSRNMAGSGPMHVLGFLRPF